MEVDGGDGGGGEDDGSEEQQQQLKIVDVDVRDLLRLQLQQEEEQQEEEEEEQAGPSGPSGVSGPSSIRVRTNALAIDVLNHLVLRQVVTLGQIQESAKALQELQALQAKRKLKQQKEQQQLEAQAQQQQQQKEQQQQQQQQKKKKQRLSRDQFHMMRSYRGETKHQQRFISRVSCKTRHHGSTRCGTKLESILKHRV